MLDTRCDAWRLRFPVAEFKVEKGTDVARWDAEEVGTWITSITRQCVRACVGVVVCVFFFAKSYVL